MPRNDENGANNESKSTQERLGDSLRANLKKRKSQSRNRAHAELNKLSENSDTKDIKK